MPKKLLFTVAGVTLFALGAGIGWYSLRGGPERVEVPAPKVVEGHYLSPAYLTRFDFMSPGDHYYSRLLVPFLSGEDPDDWSLFDRIKSYLGRKVAEVLAAPRIAELITTSFPIEGQEATREITRLVEECAGILGVRPPAIFVRNEPMPNSYVASNSEGETYLVLTSGLLNLYESVPRELRFVIGHELGHVKCAHGRGTGVAKAVISGISTLVPDESGLDSLPPVGLGYLLSWNRESEFSADRAGLLCCQDLDVALQALMRLQHGLKPESRWLDPENPAFDADRVLGNFEKWEDEPFVKFVRKVKSIGSSHPFMDDRLAALKRWGEGPVYPQILARLREEGTEMESYRIRTVKIEDGAKEEPATSFVKFYVGDSWGYELDHDEDAEWMAVDRVLDVPRGCPVFIDVWEAGWWTGSFGDERLGLSMLMPEEGKTTYRIPVQRSVSERSDEEVPAHVIVELERIAAN